MEWNLTRNSLNHIKFYNNDRMKSSQKQNAARMITHLVCKSYQGQIRDPAVSFFETNINVELVHKCINLFASLVSHHRKLGDEAISDPHQ